MNQSSFRGNRAPQHVEPAVIAGRLPPHDLDTEAAVLAAVLLDRDAFDRVVEILDQPRYFYSQANATIFEAVKELSTNGTPIDVISVAAWLRDRERLQQVGGASYLAQLVDATPAVHNVTTYAQIIKEKARLRDTIAICQQAAAEGYGDVGTVQGFIDRVEQNIYALARAGAASNTEVLKDVLFKSFQQLKEATERGEGITGIPTGYERFDQKIAGLHEGDLMIVAARPGMGKTSFVLNVAVNVAAQSAVESGGPDEADHDAPRPTKPELGVVFFSLEMPREQLGTRLICCEGRVDLGKLRGGRLQREDWANLTQAASYLSRLPIWLDDTPALGILELRAKVRRIQANFNKVDADGKEVSKIGLVAVDYLQLMKGREGVSNREQEISEISRGLKQLAKELHVPVIALSQLNRSVETRTTKDKRPQLSDLRESGAIEQDADTIVFIYRDEYYNAETTNAKGIAELIVAKQRNGPTGKVLTRFTSSCTRFDNLALGDYPEGLDEDD